MSSLYLDIQYVNLISSRLERFKKKDKYTFSFRCPLCGDSEKSKYKTRGNIFKYKDTMMFHCYNCNASMGFASFLEHIDSSLYKEYRINLIKNKIEEQNEYVQEVHIKKRKADEIHDMFNNLSSIEALPALNMYRQYVKQRKIPYKFWNELRIADQFNSFVNSIIPGKMPEKSLQMDEPRLIIPFFNKDKKIHAFQGRSFKKNSPNKYITILLNENIPKLYGLDRINYHKNILITEGPIDAMFLKNGIATAGGDLSSSLSIFDKDKCILIYDNEPRKIQTIKKIEKAIDIGYKVVLFPENIQWKDVNDAILSGLTVDQLHDIIYKNIYSGIKAKLKLIEWKKI